MPDATDSAPDGRPAGPPPPRANPDLIGHGDAEAALHAAYCSGRLAHAWLITGPPGIGKATIAFRFARYVLADGGNDLFGDAAATLAIDRDAPVFRRVAAGSHADLLTIEPTVDERSGRRRGEIRVKEVRAAGPFMRLSAAEGGWRVVVVDGADDLNMAAANALLKLLEEPPSKVLILLVSNSPGILLPTLRSRCCRLRLRPLAEAQIVALVLRHRPDLGEDEALALARLARGSAGRALRLAELGGVALYREMLELASRAPQCDSEALHAMGDRLARAGAEPAFQALMELLGAWLAALVHCGATGAKPVEVVSGEGALMTRLLDRHALAHWAGVWEKVAPLADRALRVNLDRKQVVFSAFTAFGATSRS
jgi:DNA polymerase-3 subunit delta'